MEITNSRLFCLSLPNQKTEKTYDIPFYRHHYRCQHFFDHRLVPSAGHQDGVPHRHPPLLLGIVTIMTALVIENVMASSILGVIGASLLWSIGELFAQKKRVEKGWFPMNPKRKDEYQKGK